MEIEDILKMRIERTEKTTKKDVDDFFIRIYGIAESLGFKVVIPKEQREVTVSRTTENKWEKK
jgi:hypothetical protein|tara:strand:+ start:1740 stop:1928 length:189 start_codon:yes stop_codon:yes gene_type:complete